MDGLEWQWSSQLQPPDPPSCWPQSQLMSLERQAVILVPFEPRNDSFKTLSDLGQIALVERMLCASSFTWIIFSLS